MTSRLMPPGTLMLDSASFASEPSFDSLIAAGIDPTTTILSLYLTAKYGVTRATIEAAWHAGFGVTYNWEHQADYGKLGYNAGIAAANDAIEAARQQGFDGGDTPITFSFVDTTSVPMQPALDTTRGMVVAMQQAGETGGVYEPGMFLDTLIQQDWWPDSFVMWEWGATEPTRSYVTARQTGAQIHAPYAMDVSRLLKPMNAWTGDGPNPIPPEVQMAKILQCTDANAVFVSPSDGEVHPFMSYCDAERADAFKAAGLPVQDITVAQCKYATLSGPLPTGDTRAWSVSDFWNCPDVVSGGSPVVPEHTHDFTGTVGGVHH